MDIDEAVEKFDTKISDEEQAIEVSKALGLEKQVEIHTLKLELLKKKRKITGRNLKLKKRHIHKYEIKDYHHRIPVSSLCALMDTIGIFDEYHVLEINSEAPIFFDTIIIGSIDIGGTVIEYEITNISAAIRGEDNEYRRSS